jgi:dUTP pyrophosphatase
MKSLNMSKYAHLKIYVNKENTELVELYKNHIESHNQSMRTNPFPNSGFDIFFPDERLFEVEVQSTMVSMEIKTEMVYYDTINNYAEPSAFYIFPRSSMSKTPLMLANHTGIIDCGYRGWIIGAFRWLNTNPLQVTDVSNEYAVEKHTRLLQICHPSLCPITVELVDDEAQLSTTIRGDGAFGSTGKIGSSYKL